MSKTTRLSAWKHVDDHSLRFVDCEEVDRLGPVAFAGINVGPGILMIHIGIENGYMNAYPFDPVVTEYTVNLLSINEVVGLEKRLSACGCFEPAALLLHIREWAERAFDNAAKQRDPEDEPLGGMSSIQTATAPFTIEEGDIVLIVATSVFGGTFMIVERVETWGAVGFIPGINGAECPFRAGWDDMKPTGGKLPAWSWRSA
ncbi:hypothetical protein [Shinella zoogloeoides]|uniref:hypothetical protein n=1 Tax=Shinella zoogloeoides TaxID=352475 RepID=UPI0028AFC3CD|nr:hypothetical protein [Shinella zoogloeoides]